MKKIIFVVIFILCFTVCSYGQEIDDSLGELNFGGIDSAYEKITGTRTDFRGLVRDAAENNVGGIYDAFKEMVGRRIKGEVSDVLDGLRILLVAAVLGGLYKNLISAFHDKETGEIGFAVSYMLTVGIALGAFLPVVKLMEDYCEGITEITAGGLPLMLTVITAGGRPASALAFNTLMSVCIVMIGKGISLFIIPLINMSIVMCAVNYLSEEPMLEKLSELLKSIVGAGIKGAAFIFTFVAGLNKLTSGLGNNIFMTGTKSVIGMVPIAGDIITGSLDTGLSILNSIKSGVGVVFIAAVVAYAALPVLRVLITAYAFKLISGILQPLCDKRMVELLDRLGDYGLLILSVIFVVSYIFVFGVMIFVAVGSGG